MARHLIMLFAFTLVSSIGHAASITGTVFEKGSNRKNILYQYDRQEGHAGPDLTIKTTFTSPDNKVVAIEDTLADSDNKLKKFSLHQFQTNEEGGLEVKGNKVLFSYTKEGKTTTSDEDVADNLVCAATLVGYLLKHWDALMKGDTVDVRFAVLDRKETVGFKFFKTGDVTFDGKPAVIIKMKPSSFIIAAIVDPLNFTFLKDTRQIAELVGRTTPKQLVDGKWKDLDADIIYHWKPGQLP